MNSCLGKRQSRVAGELGEDLAENRRERGQKSNEGINFGTFESDRR